MVEGYLSSRRLTMHGAIVFMLRELARLAGEEHANSVEDDISGPTSGLSIDDAIEQVMRELSSVAPAGWYVDLDDNGQPFWARAA